MSQHMSHQARPQDVPAPDDSRSREAVERAVADLAAARDEIKKAVRTLFQIEIEQEPLEL